MHNVEVIRELFSKIDGVNDAEVKQQIREIIGEGYLVSKHTCTPMKYDVYKRSKLEHLETDCGWVIA
jgi:hypothetical protein